MAQLRTRIVGTGGFVPPRTVRNDEFRQWMDTSDEWIQQRTGIVERRWVEGTTTTSELALEAARQALERARVRKQDLDMLVLATLSPDHEFPGTACFLQARLDVPGIPALDVRQQCCGFIYALAIADQFLRTGTYKRVLVVGAEIHSKGLDLSERGREVAVLFGDGAGAVVLEACTVDDPRRDPHIMSTHLHADGHFARELWVEAPSQTYDGPRISAELMARGAHFPTMNGRAVFTHAVRRMPEAVLEAIESNGVRLEEVDLFVFHQANLRINEQVARHLGVPDEKVFNTVQRYANTTAATIPLGLHEAVLAGRLQPGMLVACAAFGSGFTWASALVRW